MGAEVNDLMLTCAQTHNPATFVLSAKNWRVLSLSLILSA